MAMSPGEAAAPPQLIPLNAPSQRPDEPITFGSIAGPGPGPESLGLNYATEKPVSQILFELAPYDPTGEVQAMAEQALLSGY
jgi:hypothetical protein